MTQIDTAVAEFNKTIAELGVRLANAAMQIHALQEQNSDLTKQVEDLKSKPKEIS